MLPKLTSTNKRTKEIKNSVEEKELKSEQVNTDTKDESVKQEKPKRLTKKEQISAIADSWTKIPKTTYDENGDPIQSIPDIDDLNIKGEIKKYLS